MMFPKTLAYFAIAKAVSALPATTDIYYHEKFSTRLPEAMWVFSSAGLSILSVDGAQTLKTLSTKDLDCGAGGCNYFDVVTDGHKYVWANALHSSPNRIDVFALDSGDYLGGIATCDTPLDSDYVVNREELWVRCAGLADPNNPQGDHLRVVPTTSLAGTYEDIRLTDRRSYGYATFHSSLGNYGYATANDEAVIWKIDLAHRTAVANFTLDKAFAAYDMTYSKVNKHLYIRPRVCCTCGFEGADAATCGRFGPGSPGQNIQTGPSIGRTDLNGTCGVSCEGSAADTMGVLEFDTVSEEFVGSHSPLEGFGATAEASPDGQYVVLFANDGGKNLRVLKAGNNGATSTVAFDVALDFANVPPGREAISDFAFVNWKNHNVLALASGYDNELALVDLSKSPPTVTKLTLSDSASQTGGNGGRMVEWAYGTDYLWIDASATNEVYVVKLSENGSVTGAAVERTLQDIPSGMMIYVENFAERAQIDMLGQVFVSADGTTQTDLNNSAEEVAAELISQGYLEEQGNDSTLGVAAFAIGIASLLFNVILTLYVISYKKVPSASLPKEHVTSEADDKTLGSKRVA
eukprot:scaffold2724_cov193-Amphora_coffeaeformis.AAC.3